MTAAGQVAGSTAGHGAGRGDGHVVALCDDGSIWELSAYNKEGVAEKTWAKLPDIPQEDS